MRAQTVEDGETLAGPCVVVSVDLEVNMRPRETGVSENSRALKNYEVRQRLTCA